jgi:MFS family permease
VVAVIFLFMAISGVGEGVMGTLFVPFVVTILSGDEFAYGAVVAAQAVGGLLGSAVIGQIGRHISPQRLFAFGAIILGAIDFCIFNAHRIYPGVLPPIVLMMVVGIPAAAIGIGYTTLVQTAVADEYRGRVFGSVSAVLALSLLIGSGLAGALGNTVGVVALLSIQAIGYPLAGLIVLLALAPIATKLPDRTQPEAETST